MRRGEAGGEVPPDAGRGVTRWVLRVGLGFVAVVLVAATAGAAYVAYDRHMQSARGAQVEHLMGAWREWAECVVEAEAWAEPCDLRGECMVGETAEEAAHRLAADRARIRESVALALATRAGRQPGVPWLDTCAALPGPSELDRQVHPELATTWQAARDRVERWRAAGAPDRVEEYREIADALVAVDALTQLDLPPPPARYSPPEDEWPEFVPVAPVDRRRAGDALTLTLQHPTRGVVECSSFGGLPCTQRPAAPRRAPEWQGGAPPAPIEWRGREPDVDVVCPLAGGTWAMTLRSSGDTEVAIGDTEAWRIHHLEAEDRVQGCVGPALVAMRTSRAGDRLTLSRTQCTRDECVPDEGALPAPSPGEEVRAVDLGSHIAALSQREGGPLRARVGSLAALSEVEPVVASLEPGRALGEVVAREGQAIVLDARSSRVRFVSAEDPAATACDLPERDR